MHQVHAICTQSIITVTQNHVIHLSNNTLRRITIHSLYTRLQFCICNTKVSMARAALCAVLCAVYWPVSSSGYLPRSFPPYLPSSHAPPLLLSLAPLLPPSSARFLPPLFPSLRPCLSSFLTRSLPQPFLHSRSHPPSYHRFLTPPCSHPPPPSPCSLPSLPACMVIYDTCCRN